MALMQNFSKKVILFEAVFDTIHDVMKNNDNL